MSGWQAAQKQAYDESVRAQSGEGFVSLPVSEFERLMLQIRVGDELLEGLREETERLQEGYTRAEDSLKAEIDIRIEALRDVGSELEAERELYRRERLENDALRAEIERLQKLHEAGAERYILKLREIDRLKGRDYHEHDPQSCPECSGHPLG